MWVDDVFYFAEDEISLLCFLDEILGLLESVGLFVAAHKCTFLLANWFGVEKCILMVTCFVCVSGIVTFCGSVWR